MGTLTVMENEKEKGEKEKRDSEREKEREKRERGERRDLFLSPPFLFVLSRGACVTNMNTSVWAHFSHVLLGEWWVAELPECSVPTADRASCTCGCKQAKDAALRHPR
jgi:hypothetical protein